MLYKVFFSIRITSHSPSGYIFESKQVLHFSFLYITFVTSL